MIRPLTSASVNSDNLYLFARRKYLPINPSLVEGEECVNAYLNVMAPSEADEDAVICCENSTSDSGRFAFLETGICSSKVRDT